MGIDDYSFRLIHRLANAHGLSGHAMTLGRQAVNRGTERNKVTAFLSGLGDDTDTPLPGSRSFEFVEEGLRRIGFDRQDVMDMSDYQGANIVHDLTQDVPDALRGRYDLIYDGGTTEHIFDLPVALANLRDMLRVGGVLVSVNMLNGSPEHGLYQFGPDLVWSYWKRSCGFDVLSCAAQPIEDPETHEPFEIPDFGIEGKRFPLSRRLPKGRVYLVYAVRKMDDNADTQKTYQADYVVKWGAAPSAEQRIER